MTAYVYIIKDEKSNALKIGKTNNMEKRLSDLQIGNPNKLEIISCIVCHTDGDANYIETVLHNKYENLRIQGEWFQYSEEIINETYDKHLNSKIKGKRSPLSINTLFGEELKFGVNDSPRCYFYPELMAQIMYSYEDAIKIKNPFRTMEWPTNGKRMLLPYSTEVDRVFISTKKHEQNIEHNNYLKEKNNISSLSNFFS